MGSVEAPAVCVRVPFLDLRPAHAGLKRGLLTAFSDLIDAGSFANGPQIEEFEHSFATYCATAHCIGVSCGLDALRLALLAADIEPGDEVLVPANTFVATFEAVTQAGGLPVPVDVTEVDYNLDVAAAAASISPRTRFVLPVHLYGQMADMRALLELGGAHRLHVVEDACQAHGAERDGLRAGAGGLAGAFSFYPGKNLGAFGDAGALVTDDAEIAARVRALREHGQRTKYRHDRIGYTARLDTIQAVVLSTKLPHLDRWNVERQTVARLYTEVLDGVGDLVLPPVAERSHPVWHLYPVRTAKRAALAEFLQARGIATGRHYPEPPHLSRAYRALGYGRGDFPVTEALAEELVSLPIFPGITEQQLDAVTTAVREYFARG